jgi:hypothetical protein
MNFDSPLIKSIIEYENEIEVTAEQVLFRIFRLLKNRCITIFINVVG